MIYDNAYNGYLYFNLQSLMLLWQKTIFFGGTEVRWYGVTVVRRYENILSAAKLYTPLSLGEGLGERLLIRALPYDELLWHYFAVDMAVAADVPQQ